MKNGMIDQASSSGIEPVIGAPTFSRSSVAVLHGEVDDHDSTTRMREERRDREDEEIQLVHLGASVDACSGNSGMPDNIDAQACLSATWRDSRRRISTTKPSDETNRQHAAQPHEVHDDGAVPPARRVVVEAVEQQLVDDRADAPSPDSTSASRSSFGEYSTP